ncbi:aminotransferase class I/II-fold pyridoxal phosphate-dependent enzyme [Pseudomonas viridiflava]|uniref:aminotransferase class I/II-fold pyridoxal phosphate-dependent enzyme n=1 Tax=Pseudomonas viridiflava TaxID=33069 RepID=UPI000C0699E2|nr:PLP-dependent aminotransferase family protein [Pseudomonas viridiflava]PHN62016.1 GntR family transcriptional regulator [Pseudomonas viridiflava]
MKNKTDFAYQAVYRYLLRLVNEAQDTSPAKLPSLRQLARRLKVSISTVQSAYSMLEKEQRVCSVPKSGYYSIPSDSSEGDHAERDNDSPLLDLYCRSARRPGVHLLGSDEPSAARESSCPLLIMERELARLYPRSGGAGFQPFGDVELRAALAARYTRDAGQGWYADNVYIGPDLPGMLKAVIETLELRGTTVLVESPCPWTLLRLLQAFDIRVIEIPLDERADIDLDELERVLLSERISLALLSSLLNPVRGSIRSDDNTSAAALLLNRHKVWVLENDSHGELLFARQANRLRHLIDPQHLLILGSFAKTLGPDAPYGYLLCQVQERDWQRYFMLRSFELSPIRQKAIARLYTSGRLDTYLASLRLALSERMRRTTGWLDLHLARALRYEIPAGGSGVWAETQSTVDMRKVFTALLEQRVLITPGELFSIGGLHRQHLRIGCAVNDESESVFIAINEAFEQASGAYVAK